MRGASLRHVNHTTQLVLLQWDGNTLLTHIAGFPSNVRTPWLTMTILNHGANPTIPQRYVGETVLMRQAKQNNIRFTAYFTETEYWDTLVSATSANGSTALHYAVNARSHDAIRVLVRSKIALNAQDITGNTALHHAVASNNQKAVEQLLTAGTQPVVLNKFFEDPVSQAFTVGNRNIINAVINNKAYSKGFVHYKDVIRARFTRLHRAFQMRLPQSSVLRLLEAEFRSNDTTLCIVRDREGRNIIAMAIDNQYEQVLELLLDHFRQAYINKPPMWQRCNVHEPSHDNVFPLEKFLRGFQKTTENATNLRKLLTAVVPVDGTSALMHAIRHKGTELVLANFIPYGNPDVLLSDLKLDAHESGAEAWGHNALTLVSELPGAGGRAISKRLLNLMAVGVISNVADVAEAFLQSLSTAANLRDAALIGEIAEQAAPAVQLWYCLFKKISAAEAKEATFLTKSLPSTFPGFSNRIPCSPIVHHVELVLDALRQGHIPRIDVVEALSRPADVQFNPGRHIREALYRIGMANTHPKPTPPPPNSMEVHE